jgi:hypothetical protein
MVDVIVSFDSEDFLTPEAADAELWWADALRQRGIRGSFQVVGEMVRTLQRQGRSDVIRALAGHEIGYHSNFHSLPPTHPPAVEHLSLSEAVAYVVRTEAPGVADVASAFSAWPISYCSPGDSWTPATLLAMARMGMRVFCNDRLANPGGKPYWYCGMLVAAYALDFQDYYDDDVFVAGAFERDFDHLVATTPEDGVIVLYTHPTRLVTAEFWDAPFFGGKNPNRATCPPAPLRPVAEVARVKARCQEWLDGLRRRNDLRFIDFATLYQERAENARNLDVLLSDEHLHAGQEGELPLRYDQDNACLPASAFDDMRYEWKPYPETFVGRTLITQAAGLAWTAAPAHRGPPSSVPESTSASARRLNAVAL